MTGISIIICTYNGKARIKDALHSIINLKSDSEWELIIVNNSSTDGTDEFCSQYLSTYGDGIVWKIVQEEKPGLAYARLKGFIESKYDYLLYCDDDNSLSKDYLNIGFSLMESCAAIGALGGQGFPIFEGVKPDWFDNYSHSYALGPQSVSDGKMKSPASLYGAGTFFRRNALDWFIQRDFKTVLTGRKGKNLTAGDDVEWCYLVQLAGYEIWYDHRLTFGHIMPEGRLTWSYYLKLKQAIAAGACRLMSYECLLKDRQMSLVTFMLRWSSEAMLSTLIYLKHRAINLVRHKATGPETELALVILNSRFNSYWKDATVALHHFHYLKSLL